MVGKSWQVAPDTTVQVVDPMGAQKEGEPDEERRNWASIIISLSLIFFVLLMVTIATLLMGPQDPPFFGRRLVMSDLFDVTLRPKPMPYQWLQGDKLAYMSEGAGVRLLDLETGSNVTLVTELAMRQTEAVEFTVSPDQRFVLLCHDVIKGRLYTRTALYSVYDVDTNHYYPLTLRGDHSTTSGLPLRLQHVEWATQHSNTTSFLSRGRGEAEDRPLKEVAPRGKNRRLGSSSGTQSSLASSSTGHALIILSNGSVYFMASPSAEPVNLSPDADPDTLTYGTPDLLYQEILQEDAALWQSPTGHALLIVSFNDSEVRELPVLRYAGGYPSVQALRYPTVSTPLPEVSLWLYDLTSPHFPPSRTRLLPPPSLQGPHYLTGGGWADEGRVWASWVGRDQASSALTLCSAPYWFCSTVLLNHRAEGVSPVVRGVQWAGKWAAFPWAAKDSLGSWHNHVALVGEAGGRRAPLTTPHYHVDHVMAANLDTHLVYFTGTVVSEMRAGKYSDQVYRASADGSNDVTCVTCHLRNKNVRFTEELEDEDEVKKSEMNSSGRAATPWDEWTDAIRDIYTWKNWGTRQSYELVQNEDKEEIDRDYDVGKSEQNQDGDTDEHDDRDEVENNGERTKEEEIGVKGEVMYNQCRSVRATLSPSSRYLVAVCMDDNGVPPSLWLLDLGQLSAATSGDREKQEEEFVTVPESVGDHIEQQLSVDKFRNRDGHFGREETHHDEDSNRSNSLKQHPPLLLHSQTTTRLSMGILGMPSTIRLGMSVGGGATGVGVDATRGGSGGRQNARARITLTLPPGWTHDDTSLLYPLIVQIASPDESPSSRWATEDELGIRWAEYLSSGHQVAHARIELWGSDPSAHTSAHILAEHHLDAIRQLLEHCPYLDGRHLAVYGRGGGGASVALEAAALAPSLIRCVTLINPITDWQAHGVYWSERLLGPPSQEGAEQRYVESNIARLASEFRNSTPILLMHGTSDQFSHHGFSLAHALNEHAAHFSHVVGHQCGVYTDNSPSMLRPTRHLLAELEFFIFTWIHDPLIYEDSEGNIVDDSVEENMRRYENRFDIKRSFGKLSSS